MAQLRITVEHELSLVFTCANYAKVRTRALEFVGDEEKLKSKCGTSTAQAILEFCPDEDADAPVWEPRPWGVAFDAFFFDNTVYNVYAELADGQPYRNLRVKSRFAADEDPKKFARLGKNGVARSGVLNFENDVGNFEFSLLYDSFEGVTKEYQFSSEVLSQKLDARADWKVMIDDVETRYSMLAADYLRRTFHSFERKRTVRPDTPDLIWWNLFESERENFFKAIRTVLERPRKRLRNVEEFVRADQLRKLTPILENQIGEFRRDAGHLYRIEYDSHSHDTPENRFIKYAIQSIGKKYAQLKKHICHDSQFGKRLSASEKERMSTVEKSFAKTLAHPFFKGIGRFTGIRQLSLTLQNAPGYATIARAFAILNASYMLFEGLRRIETKSIADLYEIWCFLKVEEIVKRICKEQFAEFFNEPKTSHGELSGKFVKQLGTGALSEVVFTAGTGEDEVELARVVYNPKISGKEQDGNGVPGTVAPTSLTSKKGQIPDIVLRLSRRSMNREKSFSLTYLFDAKYRIEDTYDEEESGASRPPQDAIDQMHRYRDAIYYAEEGKQDSLCPADLKREVIGGYVLFPGKCQGGIDKPRSGDDNRPKYFKSIDSVNIGAIPLRPNSGAEYGHLISFIEKLIAENPTLEAALDRLNPQHGVILDDASQEGVGVSFLCGTYRDAQKKWIKEKGLYNLPKSTAEKTGIFGKDDADRKKILVLLSARGYLELSTPYKIEWCKEVTKDELWHDYRYFKEPTHPEGYYLFKIIPLVEPMAQVSRKLKIVTLNKPGVCKGIQYAATAAGVEIEIVADVESAIQLADGIAVFDVSGFVPRELKQVLDGALRIRKSHQTTAMDMRRKKTRKILVRWLRILLGQVSTRKYALYLDGRESDAEYDLEQLARTLLDDVLKQI